ncbi:hypothetical protein [Laceyella putida]|uniref:Uncharacterized protein n=1 Tax=Laceyella putida TaxID=110101 RepID=A0ABW2RPS3_9BACL
MCQERLNVAEVQISLKQMRDTVQLLEKYLAHWNDLLMKKGLSSLESDFVHVQSLTEQLQSRLEHMEHKLTDVQTTHEHKISITEYD